MNVLKAYLKISFFCNQFTGFHEFIGKSLTPILVINGQYPAFKYPINLILRKYITLLIRLIKKSENFSKILIGDIFQFLRNFFDVARTYETIQCHSSNLEIKNSRTDEKGITNQEQARSFHLFTAISILVLYSIFDKERTKKKFPGE